MQNDPITLEEIILGENKREEKTVDVPYAELIYTHKNKKAVLIRFKNPALEVWIPKSQIFFADPDKIEIPIWLAKDKKLVD